MSAKDTSDVKTLTVRGFFLSNRQILRGAAILIASASAIIANTNISENFLQNVKQSKWSIHLFAFACYYGCSMWVTFVGGLVMFKSLPRHTFGKLQSKLFPRYFQFSIFWIGLCLAMESLILVDKHVNTNSTDQNHSAPYILPNAQLYNFLLIMVNLLCNHYIIEPKTTKLMFKRHTVERKIGTGHEVGITKPAASILEAANKEDVDLLQSLSKEFGKLHGISASLNLLALILGTWHLFWLGARIKIA